MLRVADALSVTKMALYRYGPGKAELVALMIDIGIGEAQARRIMPSTSAWPASSTASGCSSPAARASDRRPLDELGHRGRW